MLRTFNLGSWFKNTPDAASEQTLETAPVHVTESGVLPPHALGASASDASERGPAVDDDIAARLARIWEKLLAVETVRPDDNYFDLGGDSSVTIQLFVQIEKVFGVKLPVTSLFEAPTVAELAAVLREEMSALNRQ